MIAIEVLNDVMIATGIVVIICAGVCVAAIMIAKTGKLVCRILFPLGER